MARTNAASGARRIELKGAGQGMAQGDRQKNQGDQMQKGRMQLYDHHPMLVTGKNII
jgi:hypothetical protein